MRELLHYNQNSMPTRLGRALFILLFFFSIFNLNAQLTIVPPLEVCDGEELMMTVSGLPIAGVDEIQLLFADQTTGLAYSTTQLTGNAATFTFSTGWMPTFAENGDMIQLNVSFQDPNGTPILLNASTVQVPLTVYDSPAGSIANTIALPQAICEDGIWGVTFTSSCGTCVGPFDLTINGTVFAGIASGGGVSLTEDIHFAGDAANIELTQIVDTGVPGMCAATVSSIVTGPQVVDVITPGVIVATTPIVCIQPPANPGVIRGNGVGASTAASGDGAITYSWEESTNGGGTWTATGHTGQNRNPPMGQTQTKMYRRQTTFTLMGVACTHTTNEVTITIEDGMAAAVDGDGDGAILTETVCDGETTQTNVDVTDPDGHKYYVMAIVTAGMTATTSVAPYTRADNATIDPGTLTNTGVADADITYTICAYTDGPDGVDNDAGGDDCLDLAAECFDVVVTVEPELISEVSAATETICSGDTPLTLTGSLDGSSVGVGDAYLFTAAVNSGAATGFSASRISIGQNLAVELTPITNSGLINAVVRYEVFAYSFGPDGMDNGGTGDDCVAAIAAILDVTIEPVPQAIAMDSDGNGALLTETVCHNTIPLTKINVTALDGNSFLVSNIVEANANGSSILSVPFLELDGGLVETSALVSSDGVTAGTVTYTIQPYTFGPDGNDDGGNTVAVANDGNQDDCLGIPFDVVITVEPDPQAAVTLPDADLDGDADPNTETICNGGTPLTTIDVSAINGQNYVVSGTSALNVTGSSVGVRADGGAIEPNILTSTDGINAGTITYTIQPYTNGPDGIDGSAAMGSDDCLGTSFTVVVTVLPKPEAASLDIDLDGDPKGETICHNTVPVTTVDVTTVNGNNYLVNSTVLVNISGVTATPYTRADLAIIETSMLTSTNGTDIGQATYTIFPYTYGPNGVDDSGMGDDCLGTSFEYDVVVQPEATGIDPADETICSGDNAEFDVMTNMTLLEKSFNWSAVYGVVTGGGGPTVGISFGMNAISDGGLINATAAPIIVTYTITPYTWGANGVDNDGGVDDCIGVPFTVDITVTSTPEATVVGPDPDADGDANIYTEEICSGDAPAGLFDVVVGDNGIVTAVSYGAVTGGGRAIGNIVADNGAFELNMIENKTIADIDVSYTVCPYGFGANGVDDMATGDDCTTAAGVDDNGATNNGMGSCVVYTVTVHPEPVAVNQTFTVCSGDVWNFPVATYFTNTPTEGIEWKRRKLASPSNNDVDFEPGPGGGGFLVPWNNSNLSSGANMVINNSPNPQTITYEYRIRSAVNQCRGDNFTIAVTVLPVVSASIVTLPDLTLCDGESRGLSAVVLPAGSYTYTWGLDANMNASVVFKNPTTLNPSFVPTLTNPAMDGEVTIFLEVNDATNGCLAARTTVTFDVFANPVAAIVSSDADNIICEGESVTLTASGGGTYQWNDLTASTAAAITVSPTQTTSYSVVVTNMNGCTDTETVLINVTPKPVAPQTTNDEVCVNAPAATITGQCMSGGGGSTYTFALEYQTDYTGEISWEIVNTTTGVSMTGIVNDFDIGFNTANLINNWTFDVIVPAGESYDYEFRMMDSYGDGLEYLDFGDPDDGGYYTITVGANTCPDGCDRCLGTTCLEPLVFGTVMETNTFVGLTGAPPIPGACVVNWYDAITGGNLIATGNSLDVFTIAPGNPGYTDPTAAAVHNYYAECFCVGCPSDRTLATVTINAAPVINITAAGPFCEYEAPVNLSATPAGGTWSGTGITNTNLGTFDPEVAHSHVNGSGTQTFAITYTFTDANSCTNAAVVMIDVTEDTTAPTIAVCTPAAPVGYTLIAGGMNPDTLRTSVSPVVCSAVPAWIAPSITDDCALQSQSDNVGPFYVPGNYLITYSATDESGNMSTCSFIFSVVDDIMPNIFACPLDDSIDTDMDECDQTYTWNGPAVADPCGLLSWRIEYVAGMPAPASLPTGGPLVSTLSQSFTETFYLGVTEVRYIAEDAFGNEAVCSFNVTVTEDDMPSFEDPDDISMSTQVDGSDCPDVAMVSINPGVIASGMAYTVAGIAQVAPALEAVYDIATTGYANGGYADACDVDPVLTLVSKTFVTGPCSSTWTLVWRVTDDNGNFVEQTQVFTIIDNTAPTGNAPANTMGTDACMANAVAAVPFVPATIAMGYTDNCLGALTILLTNTDLQGTDCAWTLIYTYSVADVCGNTLLGESVTHTGSDQTAPALTGVATPGTVGTNECMSDATGAFSFDANLAIVGYTDNCGAAVTANLTNTAVAGTDCAWTLTYTYEVIDVCGNILAGQTYTHQGSNQTAPSGASTASTINTNLCLADVAANFAFNAANAVDGYMDACGNTSTAVGPNAVAGPIAVETGVEVITGNDCSWTVTYTFKVVDGCGNELTGQTYTHTGSDQTAPAGAAPASTVGNNSCAGTAIADYPYVGDVAAAAGYADNCGAGVTATLTNSNVVLAPNGCDWVLTYTFDVEDACGNVLVGETYTHTGSDNTAPAGMTTAGSVGNDLCFTDVAGTFAFDAAAAVGGYSDVCGGTITAIETGVEDIMGGDCGWTVTYTFKVTDGCGNELLGQTYSHTGSDQTDPIGATTAGSTGVDACMAAAAGLFAFDAIAAAVGYTDNCGAGVTAVETGMEVVTGTDCAWVVTYTFKVVDACGNELLAQTYTHEGSDQTDPTWDNPIGLPQNQSYPLAATGCVFAVPFAKPAGSDNCSPPVVAATAINIVGTDTIPVILFDLGIFIQGNFPVGQNDIIITNTDACGNSIEHFFVIDILDNTPPTITCPVPSNGICDISEVPPFGNGAIGANAFVAAGGILGDNCVLDYSSFILLSETPSLATCPQVYSRVYQISDATGNTNICTHSIIIDDTVDPVMTFTPAAITLECSSSLLPVNTGGVAIATDNCGAGVVITYLDVNNLNGCGNNTGTITRTWTATDGCLNTATSIQVITIVDTTQPVMPAACTDISVMLDAMGNYTLTTADMMTMTAGVADACSNNMQLIYSADINNFSCMSGSPVAVTVTVADPCGNSNSCTAMVTIIDNVPPVAVCPAVQLVLQLDAAGSVTLPINSLGDGSSTDNCGTATETNLAVTFGCGDVGVQMVSLIAVDGSGNFNAVMCAVVIEDNVEPIAVCQAAAIVLQLDATGNVTLAANSLGDGSSTDACGIASETNAAESFDCNDVGAQMVIMTATDVNGNTDTVMCLVTIVDSVDPVAICQNITVQLDVNGAASIVATDINNGSNDNCGLASLAISPSSFNCADVGSPVAVTLIVTDTNGNTDQCIATVTVEDNVDPVAVCPATITLQLDASGSATLAANALIGNSTDACGIASETSPMTVFGCADVGLNMVALTAVDVNGHSNTAMCTVIVQDNLGPVFSCPAPSSLTAAANNCFALYSETISPITDNCTGGAGIVVTVVAQFVATGDPVGVTVSELAGVYTIASTAAGFPVGDTEVTVTAMDGNANASSCSYIVTVDDVFAPIIAGCPGNINATADMNTCMAIVTWTAPTASDFCPGFMMTATHNPGDAFPIGTTTVTYTAVDPSGNMNTCSFDVIVGGICMMDIDISTAFAPVSSSFVVGDTRDLVVRIRNLGADASVGQVTFAINKPAGFNTTFNPAQTNAFTLIGITSVNNADWTLTVIGNTLLFQSNTVIPGGSESKVALHLEAVSPGSSSNATTTVQNGSGGESNFLNNIRSKFLNITQ